MSTKFFNKCGDKKTHETEHLCQIILRKDLGKIRELVKESEYFCKKCGRTAKNLHNLCNPAKID